MFNCNDIKERVGLSVKKYLRILPHIMLLASLILLTRCLSEMITPQREQSIRHIVENGIQYSPASGIYDKPN